MGGHALELIQGQAGVDALEERDAVAGCACGSLARVRGWDLAMGKINIQSPCV